MDTIADFVTRIRNAGLAKHDKVDVPSSNIRQGIARILKENGYIKTFRVAQDGKQGLMRVYLNYSKEGKPAIANIQRVSRPRKRIYVKKDEIPQIRSGFGISILSTNKGVLSGEEATDKNVGGELLLKIW
jgi:small subunit ribosomal protein S8